MTDSRCPLNVRGLRGLVLNSRTTTRAHCAGLAGVVVPIDGTNYPRTVCTTSLGIEPPNEPAHRFHAWPSVTDTMGGSFACGAGCGDSEPRRSSP